MTTRQATVPQVVRTERVGRLLDRAADVTAARVLLHVREVEGPGGYRVQSLEEHELLYRLAAARAGQVRIGQLESVVIRDKNKITRIVDRLEVAGLAERSLCPTDRRITFVRLTQPGATMLAAIGPAWARGLRDGVSRVLTTDEVVRAAALTGRALDGALSALQTRFGVRTGDDSAALALPALQQLVARWREEPPVGADHVVLWIRLLRLRAALDDALERSHHTGQGLSRTEAELVTSVASAGEHGLPLTTLAATTGITSGGLTRMVDRLVRRGLLARVQHPTDRRSALVVLTEEGVPVARSAGRARREVLLTGLTARLDDAELAELEPVLAKVADPDAPAGQAGGSSPGRRR